MFRNRFRFAEDGTPQGGSDDNPAAKFQRLLQRHENDAAGLAAQLYHENYQARQRIRELEEQARTLQGRVPDDSAVILTGEEAQAWEAYRSLGSPDEIQQGLDQRAQYAEQLSSLEREQVLREAAEQSGYKPAVLAQLDRMAKASGKALTFEVREEDRNGQRVKIPFVKDGENENPLTEYATREWADFLPALSATSAPTVPGTRFPPQHPGGNGRPAPPTNVVDAFEQERAEKAKQVKNPLLRE